MSNAPQSPAPVPSAAPPQVADSSAADRTNVVQKKPLRERSPILAHLRRVLVTGLLTAIPLFITGYIIGIFYGFATEYTHHIADWIVGHIFGDSQSTFINTARSVTSGGLAIAIALFIVYILGLLSSFFIGRQILAQFEHFIGNLPLIKGIYGTIKQVMAVFRQGGGGAGFQRVVLVEFPREGTWTLAFVTNTVHDAVEGQLVCCFIPMTPNPTSGFFQMFPEDQVRNTDWSVDMGIKIVLSGGLLAPRELTHPEVKPAANDSTAPRPPTASARADGPSSAS